MFPLMVPEARNLKSRCSRAMRSPRFLGILLSCLLGSVLPSNPGRDLPGRHIPLNSASFFHRIFSCSFASLFSPLVGARVIESGSAINAVRGLPQWLSGKESACNAGDPGSIPGAGKSPGGGYGNPLQYSCLENPMDRGAWWATVHGVTTESDMTEAT